LHDGRQEMFRGRLVPCHENPSRLDYVMSELQRRPVGVLRQPGEADLARCTACTAPLPGFSGPRLGRLGGLNPANAELDILPSIWPVRGFGTRPPAQLHGAPRALFV
jgi:hypothetical protein